MYFGKKPNLAHLRVFGNIAYVHVPKEKRRKLDAQTEKCILVDYSENHKGYTCYNPRTKQAHLSRDVVFNEFASWYLPTPPTLQDSILISKKEVSEVGMPREAGGIGSLEESLISFRLNGPNE